MDFSRGIAKRTRSQWALYYKEYFERRKKEGNEKREKGEVGSSKDSCVGSRSGAEKKRLVGLGEEDSSGKKKKMVVIDSDVDTDASSEDGGGDGSSKSSCLGRKSVSRCDLDEEKGDEEEEGENAVLHQRKMLQNQDHDCKEKGDYVDNGLLLNDGFAYKPQHQYPTYQSPTLFHDPHNHNQARVAQGELSVSAAADNEEDEVEVVEMTEGSVDIESLSDKGSCLQRSDSYRIKEEEGERHFSSSNLISDSGLLSKMSENGKDVAVDIGNFNISNDDDDDNDVDEYKICIKIEGHLRENIEDGVGMRSFDTLSDLRTYDFDEREEKEKNKVDTDSCNTNSDEGDNVEANDGDGGDGDNDRDGGGDDGNGVDEGHAKGEATETPVCTEFCGDKPAPMYDCFDPYSSAGSPVHTVGHDTQQYGPQEYDCFDPYSSPGSPVNTFGHNTQHYGPQPFQNPSYYQSRSPPNEPYSCTQPPYIGAGRKTE